MILKLAKSCGVFAAGCGATYLFLEKSKEMFLTAEKTRRLLQSYPQIGSEKDLNFWVLRNTECARAVTFLENKDPTASCLRLKNTLIGQMFDELKLKENGISEKAITTDDEMRQLRLLASKAYELNKEVNLAASDATASIEAGARLYAYRSVTLQDALFNEEGNKTLILARQISEFSKKLNDRLHHNWRPG